jgi:pilus assembly protein CpaB
MNPKALIPLIAGLGIGGLALVLGINTLKNARAGQPSTAKVKIWAAKEDIPRGTKLNEHLLVEVTYPAESVPEGAFKQKEDLVGRVPRLVAPAGLPILETMLAPAGTRPGIFVKPGYRAVAVKIDAGSGVDYHLDPGCFVDVVGSFKVTRNNRSETIARTIVENVEVAAVGPRVSPSTGSETDKKEKERDRSAAVRAVTLFVKPEDVPKLLLTEQQGRIKLSMRGNPGVAGDEPEPDRWASEQDLTGQAVPNADPAAGQPTGAASPLGWLRGLLGHAGGEMRPATANASPVARWVLKIYRGNTAEILQFKNSESSERVEDTDVSPRAAEAPAEPKASPRSDLPAAQDAVNPGDHPEPQEASE